MRIPTRHTVVALTAAVTVALASGVTAPAGAAVTGTSHPTALSAPGTAGQGQPDLRARLTADLTAAVQAGATGMLARVDDGRTVTGVAVGAARLEPRRPLAVTDQARVGSITKSFVAAATLQLVDEGRLQLSDPIDHWLPGVVPGGDKISIRMLLNHTSGIYNYTDDPSFIPAVLADPYRPWTPQELLALAFSHPPLFAPGTSWSYSNTGYILIGLVIEKITGHPVGSVLERRIIRPLHLRDTFFATSGDFTRRYAHGYLPPTLTGDGYVDASGWPPSWAWAAGAVVSTAPDLARFYQSLLSGRLLRPGLLREMTTTVEVGPGARYGLGLLALDTPCGTVWGHDGGIPGYVSFAFADRSGRRSAVVLLPTQPDEAIAAAATPALATAFCGMFGRPVPAAPPGTAAARGGSALSPTGALTPSPAGAWARSPSGVGRTGLR